MFRLGLIGGTGLNEWGVAGIPCDIESRYGRPSAPPLEYELPGAQVYFVPRHGHGHLVPPHAVNYRAKIDAFRQLKVDGVIAVNAVGGITADYHPGSLAIPDQLIDYTWGRAHSFSMEVGDDLQHVEFAQPFSVPLRKRLMSAAGAMGQDVIDGGCIAVTQGPRLETAAEVKRLMHDGCDVVGMTTMPEAALAREAGLDYASLCVSANWAAGIGDDPVTMQGIDDTLVKAMGRVRVLLTTFFGDCAND
jgi:purine nucleoside phosphorylase